MNSDSSTSDTGHKASAVFDFIVYEVKETLALITINRPEKHNAISLQTLSELQAAVGLEAGHSSLVPT
jgi:1,4-dihydroxy-2-naphthoyl-CoA synthase